MCTAPIFGSGRRDSSPRRTTASRDSKSTARRCGGRRKARGCSREGPYGGVLAAPARDGGFADLCRIFWTDFRNPPQIHEKRRSRLTNRAPTSAFSPRHPDAVSRKAGALQPTVPRRASTPDSFVRVAGDQLDAKRSWLRSLPPDLKDEAQLLMSVDQVRHFPASGSGKGDTASLKTHVTVACRSKISLRYSSSAIQLPRGPFHLAGLQPEGRDLLVQTADDFSVRRENDPECVVAAKVRRRKCLARAFRLTRSGLTTSPSMAACCGGPLRKSRERPLRCRRSAPLTATEGAGLRRSP